MESFGGSGLEGGLSPAGTSVEEFEDEDVAGPVRGALLGFYAGVVGVALVPALWATLLRATVGHQRAEQQFWWVLLLLLVPVVLVANQRTRRPGLFALAGITVTFVVVAVTAAAALWVMVNT